VRCDQLTLAPYAKSAGTFAVYALTDLAVIVIVYLFWLAFEGNTDKVRTRIFKLLGAKAAPTSTPGR
jgi:hypothetical protein